MPARLLLREQSAAITRAVIRFEVVNGQMQNPGLSGSPPGVCAFREERREPARSVFHGKRSKFEARF